MINGFEAYQISRMLSNNFNVDTDHFAKMWAME